MKQISAGVISVSLVMPGVCLMWLEAPEIASAARPGQFVMAKCGRDNLLRRPFSIHRLNEDKSQLALLFNEVGRGTHWLSQLEAGDSVNLLGPLGNGFNINPESRSLILLAGGIGIAPIYFLANHAIINGIQITLGIGMSVGGSLQTLCDMAIQLRSLCASKPLIKIAPFSEDGTYGAKGLVTSLCESCANEADQIFACGPAPMYHTMSGMPELKGRPVQVSLEVRMGCGFGVCYGCTINTKHGLKQVCRDGPVFDLDDILWDEFVDI